MVPVKHTVDDARLTGQDCSRPHTGKLDVVGIGKDLCRCDGTRVLSARDGQDQVSARDGDIGRDEAMIVRCARAWFGSVGNLVVAAVQARWQR